MPQPADSSAKPGYGNGNPCTCHPPALGHHFDVHALCHNHPHRKPSIRCNVSWVAHQDDPQKCAYPTDTRYLLKAVRAAATRRREKKKAKQEMAST